MNWKYYTAEGMRDLLPNTVAARRSAEAQLRRLFRSWGYQEVMTPEIEFADVYLDDRFVNQESLYKFSDPQGRLLALRYDNTVPLARFVATSGRNLPLPLRLAYLGTMFRAHDTQNHQFEQAGIELIGNGSLAADGEVLTLAIRTLETLGVKDYQISLNQTAFYKALTEEYRLDEDLAGMIDNKEYVRLNRTEMPEALRPIVDAMLQTTGNYEVLEAMRPLTQNPAALAALDDLEGILDYVDAQGVLDAVTIDLGLLKKLRYYTGAIFQTYAIGAPAPVLSGGRYDSLYAAFGRDVPATGFSVDLELVGQISENNPPESPFRLLRYASSERSVAFAEAAKLRSAGIDVILEEES